MISIPLALLISLVSLGFGAGIAYVALRKTQPAGLSAETEGAPQDSSRELIRLRKERDELTALKTRHERERARLMDLLGVVDHPSSGFSMDRTVHALSEVVSMKHVLNCAVISLDGFILHGDETSAQVRSMAALSGLVSGLHTWDELDHITINDTYQQIITLRHISSPEQDLLVGIWSSGVEVPAAALTRMEAAMGRDVLSVAERAPRGSVLKSKEIEHGGAFQRLVQHSPVQSLHVHTMTQDILFEQGERATTLPTVELCCALRRFFEGRSAQGCGEFEQLVVGMPEHVALIQDSSIPQGLHVVVEAQLHHTTQIPSAAMRQATTQLGWHIQAQLSNHTDPTNTPSPEDVRKEPLPQPQV